MVHHNILIVIYPAQGHLNPALQFSKRLISMGAHVTLATTLHVHRRMSTTNNTIIPGLSLVSYSDGYDDGFKAVDGDAAFSHYASELRRRGLEFVTNLISSRAKEGEPFTRLIYTLIVPWAQEAARGFQLPTAMLWVEPATVLDIHYYFFHGYSNYIRNRIEDDSSSSSVTLPGLPLSLSQRDIPTIFWGSKSRVLSSVLPLFEEQFQALDKETNPIVLVNTFEALEPEALRAVDGITMIPIGPLIPSAFLDGKDPSDNSFGGDVFQSSNDCVEWLDSKAESSVIYVSFGSYLEISQKQMEELARALIDCGRPFLWVIKEKEREEVRWREELEERGKIVKWCTQVEVLSHSSLGCFVTHCGWNSIIESLVCGIPLIGFPQWLDQMTNAKLIEDVWKIGVRMDHHVSEEEPVVEAKEIKRCLEMVMGSGEKGEEVRRNAEKWKILAREAAKEGGPTERNLRTFLDNVVVGQGKCEV